MCQKWRTENTATKKELNIFEVQVLTCLHVSPITVTGVCADWDTSNRLYSSVWFLWCTNKSNSSSTNRTGQLLVLSPVITSYKMSVVASLSLPFLHLCFTSPALNDVQTYFQLFPWALLLYMFLHHWKDTQTAKFYAILPNIISGCKGQISMAIF